MKAKQLLKGLRAAVATFTSYLVEGKFNEPLEESIATRYESWGKKIVCAHCGGDTFFKGEFFSGGYGLNFHAADDVSGLDVLVCSRCRRLEVFATDLKPHEGGS